MMGSVLSLLDPIEPIAALAGDRRLRASLYCAAASKHLQPPALRDWSSPPVRPTSGSVAVAAAGGNGRRNSSNRKGPSASYSDKTVAGGCQVRGLVGPEQQAVDLGQAEALQKSAGSRRASAAAAQAQAHEHESAAGLQQQRQRQQQREQQSAGSQGKQMQQQQTDTRRRQSAAGQVEVQRMGLALAGGGPDVSSSAHVGYVDGSSSSSESNSKANQLQEQQVAKLLRPQAQREQRTQKNNHNHNHKSTMSSASSSIIITNTKTTTIPTKAPCSHSATDVQSPQDQLVSNHLSASHTCRLINQEQQNKFNNQQPRATILPQHHQPKLMGQLEKSPAPSTGAPDNTKVKLMMSISTNQQQQPPASLKGCSKRQQQQHTKRQQANKTNQQVNQDQMIQNHNQNNPTILRNRNPRSQQQHQHQQQLQDYHHHASGKLHQTGNGRRRGQQVKRLAPNFHKAPSGCPAAAGGSQPEITLQNTLATSKNQPAGNNRHQHALQLRQPRDHRSLSTSSSLASSGSSSPSSSMLHIFSHRELQRQRQRRNQQQQQQEQNINPNYHHRNSCSRPPSSSASSTISSLSSSEPKQMILGCGQQQLGAANPPQPMIRAVNEMNPALWALAGQQPHLVQSAPLELDCHPPPPLCFFPAPPPPRQWLMGNPTKKTSNNKANKMALLNKPKFMMDRVEQATRVQQVSSAGVGGPEFTVISYNVLCDRLVSSKMFPSSPGIALDWQYRRELILRQLLEFDADIIALQELEVKQFEDYFGPELNQLGNYESIFEPKSRARYMDNDRRQRVDGCAIFFKRHKFKLLQSHLLEFNQIAMANAQGSEAMLNRVMTKDNIGLAAVLEFIGNDGTIDDSDNDNEVFKDTLESNFRRSSSSSSSSSTKLPPNQGRLNPLIGASSSQVDHSIRGRRTSDQQDDEDDDDSIKPARILVCNTHIHWDPECCDVKLVQTIMLMNELECLARHYATTSTTTHHIMDHLNLDPGPRKEAGELPLLPLVLVGDFNSMPNSGVATYLTAGKINSLHDDFKSFKYTSCSNALVLHQKFHQHHWSQPSGDNDSNNNNTMATNNGPSATGNAPTFRRQSSPAWCFYPSSTSACHSSASSSYSSSPPTSYTSSSSSPSPSSSPGSPLDHNQINKSPPSSTKEIEQHQQMKQILNYNHPFKLASAYDKDTMPYTNYTDKFKAIIDYIFYSRDSIQLMGLLGPLDKNWLKGNRIKGLPQPHLPSDHLPLLVKLKLTTASSSSRQDACSPPAPIPTSGLSPSPLPPPAATVLASPNVAQKSHFYYNHQQQQTIDFNDYSQLQRGGGGGSKRQQLCKSQSVRVTPRNRIIKYEQIRS